MSQGGNRGGGLARPWTQGGRGSRTGRACAAPPGRRTGWKMRATNRRPAQPRGTMGVAEGRSTKWRRCVLPSAPFPLLDSDPPPRRMNQSARAVTTQQPISGGPVPCEAKGPISGPEKSHFYVSGRPFLGPKTPVLGQKRLFFNPHHLGLKKAHFGAQKIPVLGQESPILGPQKCHF